MEEFSVKIAPKVTGKKVSVFRMHKNDHVPWSEAKMKRKHELEPWQIKTGKGQASKRYTANKVGNVDENTDYFIFHKPPGKNTYEVCPVDEWYNVQASQRYKALTAEEAEEAFTKRAKTYNHAALMRHGGEEGGAGGSTSESKSFKISEMDDWEGSDDDFSGSENGDAESKKKKKPTKKEKGADKDDVPEEGKEDSDEGDYEQREVDYMSETSSDSGHSDKDGEGGGRRDENDVKGIDEEQALRDLLDSDEEDEEDSAAGQGGSQEKANKSAKGGGAGGEAKQDPEGNGASGGGGAGGANGGRNSGDSSDQDDDDDDDDDDYDVDEEEMDSRLMKKSLPAGLMKQESPASSAGGVGATKVKQEPGGGGSGSGGASSSSNSAPVHQGNLAANKRKLAETLASATGIAGNSSGGGGANPPAKRACTGAASSSTSLPNTIERTIEDLIKKYLRRKPTTLKTLLRDIKAKLRRMGSSDLEPRIQCIAEIIKRLNPERQKLNGEIYLSLKS